MEVHIVSKKLIKPSSPTPHHLRCIRTSFLDNIAPPVYVPVILYYSTTSTSSDNSKPENTVQIPTLLEKSLSDILTQFYPLAGRYNDDDHTVDCNDQGVDFWEVEVDGKLSEILDGDYEMKLLNDFVPRLHELETNPLLAIQINMFSCGGLAIGVCVSHRVADGFSVSTFINEWSKSCLGGFNEAISPPSYDLGILFPTRDLSMLRPPEFVPSEFNLVTRRFLFDGNAIAKLKAMVEACNAARSPNQQATRVEVVTAIIWKSLIAASQAKNGRLRDSLLTHSVNLRSKLDPLPHPEKCFGNFYKLVTAKFKAHERKTAELCDLLELLTEVLNGVKRAKPIRRDDDDFFSMVVDPHKDVNEALYNKKVIDLYMFTSFCRFPLYEADFGWGKPTWLSSIEQISPMVVLMDDRAGKGIEAWVCLDKEEMLHFEHQPDIKNFTSLIDIRIESLTDTGITAILANKQMINANYMSRQDHQTEM